MLSRQQMEEVINGGGSVKLPNGKLATRLDQLPSAATFAKTPEEKEAAASDLEAQIAKLQAEKAELVNQLKSGDATQTGGDDTLEELVKETAEAGVEVKADATKTKNSKASLEAGK